MKKTYMKQIKFEEIKVIISSSNYSNLVEAFQQNINNIYFAPKIIIFTSTCSHFYENNKGYFNIDNFYKYGGITANFEDVKKFLIDEPKFNKEEINIIQNYNKKPNEVQLTFEYIDCREKLLLPLFLYRMKKFLLISKFDQSKKCRINHIVYLLKLYKIFQIKIK